MDFIRRHVFFIVCGLAAVGGIALGATALRAMPRVGQEMEKAATLYRSLGQPGREPRQRRDHRRRPGTNRSDPCGIISA